MNFKIYFCADGIMRAKFSDNKPMLPLKFIQDTHFSNRSDFYFMSKWWNEHVYFEDGLTVSSFLTCLEPWAQFWTDLTGKEVAKYITEVRKPFIKEPSLENQENFDIDWLQLSKGIDAEIASEFLKTEESEELMRTDLNSWFSSPQKMRLTGKWNIYSSFTMSAFIKGHDTQYSIDYSPINEFANVPFVLNHTINLAISEHQLRRYTGNKTESIIKDGAFGVTTLGNNHDLVGDTDFSLREVVEGFFYWMCLNPESAADMSAQLELSKEEIEAQFKDFSSNEIDTPETTNAPDNTLIENSVEEAKKLKIEVSPDAFSSLVTQWEKDSQYWDSLIVKAEQSQLSLNTQSVILQQPLEKRCFGYILDENNEQHFPRATEYKDF